MPKEARGTAAAAEDGNELRTTGWPQKGRGLQLLPGSFTRRVRRESNRVQMYIAEVISQTVSKETCEKRNLDGT